MYLLLGSFGLLCPFSVKYNQQSEKSFDKNKIKSKNLKLNLRWQGYLLKLLK